MSSNKKTRYNKKRQKRKRLQEEKKRKKGGMPLKNEDTAAEKYHIDISDDGVKADDSAKMSETAVPLKKHGSFAKRISGIATGFRNWIENIRRKQPKVFDWFSKFLMFAFTLLSAFMPVFVENEFLTHTLILLTVSSLFAFQWAILANKFERELEEIHVSYLWDDRERQEYYKQITEDIVQFSYVIADSTKKLMAKIPYQDISITTEAIGNYFINSLTALEELLTNWYGFDIRASIKLCTTENSLKTYGRGDKNVESRGGAAATNELDKKEVKIEENYAYKAIICDKLKFFEAANLSETRIRSGREFYCEHKDWEDVFSSTIVMPVRTPVYANKINDQRIIGMICIDSLEENIEWNNAADTVGYKLIANYADNLYILIDEFMRKQDNVA